MAELLTRVIRICQLLPWHWPDNHRVMYETPRLYQVISKSFRACLSYWPDTKNRHLIYIYSCDLDLNPVSWEINARYRLRVSTLWTYLPSKFKILQSMSVFLLDIVAPLFSRNKSWAFLYASQSYWVYVFVCVGGGDGRNDGQTVGAITLCLLRGIKNLGWITRVSFLLSFCNKIWSILKCKRSAYT